MKFLLVVLALSAVVLQSSCASFNRFDAELDGHWDEFKSFHKKEYQTLDEENVRRSIWEENLRYINNHNLEASLGQHSHTLKMNRFGDLTNEEFVKVYNGYNKSALAASENEASKFLIPSNVKIPDSVDWRKEGYVTPIKDQGQCGSCWSFSAVASLEGQHFKQSGQLVSLSEQNLVDCSRKFGNQGCNGGLMDQAFQYIKSNKGIDTEQSYPYEARDRKCRFNPSNVGATDTGFVDIKSGDESALTAAIATVGPISVAIDASQSSFQFYSDGIYVENSCSSTQLDHGVAAVGYGTQGSGKDYYIVKNSWGTQWGMDGYILMARNRKNMCGIATSASYPLV